MAKISARGDSQRARWRHPETGAELVLTEKGRLLRKPIKGGKFTLEAEKFYGTADQALTAAAERARTRGMERVWS